MGVRPELMVGNLIGILSQRLVRRLRPGCDEASQPSAIERQILGLAADDPRTVRRVAAAWRHTEHQGYQGRAAIMELLRFDRELDDLIARRGSARELLEAARARGFVSLAEVAIRRVLEGLTSLDEVSRVVDLTDRVV
jgi:general secretion pathway protein E/type IV pilus assembly protein PilB